MFFYGIYFSDRHLQALFDIAKLVLDPNYVRKAHVTLRGPYEKKPHNKRWIGRDVGPVHFSRPDHFFSPSQNTVFLRVDNLEFLNVTWKPDFPHSTPHLSIYDGIDRRLAWQVLLSLKKFDWKKKAFFSPITVIERKYDYETSFFHKLENLDNDFTYATQKEFSSTYLKSMPAGQRIVLFERICVEIQGALRQQRSQLWGA